MKEIGKIRIYNCVYLYCLLIVVIIETFKYVMLSTNNMRTIIIDENSGNPFPAEVSLVDSASLKFAPASTEGYHHNDKLIKKTTKKLAEIIGLKSGQRIIDVGYGINLAVAEAMHEIGMEAYGLDAQDGLDPKKYQTTTFIPPYFNTEQNGVKKYCGTIEELISPESELKDERFDLFIFWGNWESSGYNFTIREWEEGRIREEHPEKEFEHSPEKLYELIQANKDKIIADVSSLLNPNGGIMIVSSRYAYHGAGFTIEHLPSEKRVMLRLGQTFFNKGAKEVYFIGLSKESVQKQLKEGSNFMDFLNKLYKGIVIESSGDTAQIQNRENSEFKKIATALSDDDILFGSEERVAYEAKYTTEMLRAIKNMQIPLGRIDTVYARF